MNENTVVSSADQNASSGAVRNLTNAEQRWAAAHELMTSSKSVSVEVVGVATNRDGRPCGLNTRLCGLRAFLPGSQLPRGTRCEDLTGQSIEVKVLECDRAERGGKLVVSHTAHLNEGKKQFVSSLYVGMEVTGTVTNFVEGLGYFVNIGPVDALLHRHQTPMEGGTPKHFNDGDSVTAKVSSVDIASGKVGLTMRAPRPEHRDSDTAPHSAGKQRPQRSWTAQSTTAVAGPKAAVAPKAAVVAPKTAADHRTRRPTKGAAKKKDSVPTQQFGSFQELLDSMSARTTAADSSSANS
ncbi:MAG: S1 RNA-binding domain-containing protein [Candidatus Melainabacteria bacterium]|nr:S1 RNA-binding domain-containing protein [Candidatus Melainabacteria bacterium]